MVYSGSRMANLGAAAAMPALMIFSSLVITAPPFISAPVPEAVTTAPMGSTSVGN